jgi:hypothetical protein
MKTTFADSSALVFVVCLFFGGLTSCRSQQTDADRKLFEAIKAKSEMGKPSDEFQLGITTIPANLV